MNGFRYTRRAPRRLGLYAGYGTWCLGLLLLALSLVVLPASGALAQSGQQAFDCLETTGAASSICPVGGQVCTSDPGKHYTCLQCILAEEQVDPAAGKAKGYGNEWMEGVFGADYIGSLLEKRAASGYCSETKDSKYCEAREVFAANSKSLVAQYQFSIVLGTIIFALIAFLWYWVVARKEKMPLARRPFLWLGVAFLFLWLALLLVDTLLIGNFADRFGSDDMATKSIAQNLRTEVVNEIGTRLDAVQGQIGTRCPSAVSKQNLYTAGGGKEATYTIKPDGHLSQGVWSSISGARANAITNRVKTTPKGFVFTVAGLAELRAYLGNAGNVTMKERMSGAVTRVINTRCEAPNLARISSGETNLCFSVSHIPGAIGQVVSTGGGSLHLHSWLALLSAIALVFLFLGRVVELKVYDLRATKTVPRVAVAVSWIGFVGCIVVIIGRVQGWF